MNPTSFQPSLHLEANYAAMREIGEWLDHLLQTPLGQRFATRRGEIELAIHELAVNIVDHAFTAETRSGAVFELHAEIIEDQLFVRSFDTGAPVQDLPAAPDPSEPQVRGYGLMIVEQLATSVHYARSSSANRWTIAFDAAQTA